MTYIFENQKYTPLALHEAKKRLYNCYQAWHHAPQTYLEIFQNHIDVVEHIGGLIGLDPAMLSKVCKDFNKELDELSDEDKQNLKKNT